MVLKKCLKISTVASFVSLLFVQLLFATLTVVTPVSAAGTAEWVDNATVKYDNRLFRDTNIDNNWHFFAIEDADDCPDIIEDLSFDPLSSNTSKDNAADDKKVTYIQKGKQGGSCGTLSTDKDITLTRPENAQFGFKWINSDLVASADERRQFRLEAGEYLNRTNEDSVCKDIITAGADKNSVTLVVKRGQIDTNLHNEQRTDRLRSDYDGYTFTTNIHYDKHTNDGKCIQSKPLTVRVADPSKAGLPPGTGEESLNNAAGGGEVTPTCESEGGALSWIICPVLSFLDEQIDKLDQAVNNFLQQPAGNFADGSPLNKAWEVMRNVAYIILVPIMLVLVIGTALGFEFVSAYTVKRALPRLVAATIFIALSWELCTFMITFINNVGKGTLGLITSPFPSIPTNLADIMGAGGGGTLFASVIGGGVAAGLVLGPALIGILLSYAFVALVAVLIAIFVLTLRQMLILLLVLIAPLAILAWIFPGNDRLWKLWWSAFSKLLLMYPLIMALIGIGRVFAGVTSASGEIGGLLEFSVKLIAYLAPYFFIPATFKFAGGVFATVAGIANDRSKGVFDRAKESRGRLAGDAMRDFKGGTAGGKYNPRRMASARIGRGLASGWKGRYGFGATGQAAMANQSNAEPDEVAKENFNFAREMVDEEVMAAVSMGNNVDKMMQLKHFQGKGRAHAEAVAARGRAVGNTTRTRVAAAKQLARSGKVVRNREEARDLAASAAGPDAGLRTGLDESLKYTWRGSGRNDIGRENIAESLSEMSVNEVSKLKPLGADGLFGDPESDNYEAHMDRFTEAFTGSDLSHDQKAHALTVLHASANSPYLNPKQQAAAQAAARRVEALEGVWAPGDLERARMRGRESTTDREHGAGAPPPEES